MNSTSLQASLRILHLEDDPHDTEIVRAMLESEGLCCDVHRVQTRAAFDAALDTGAWHLILSDFSLPSFDGLKALDLARRKCPAVPFVLFSGTIGEEIAIQSLQNGAADYVLKQRPARLVTAVRHAVKEMEEREQRRRMEDQLRRSEERKRELEAQFLRVQRMETIGALASGIAHDLNNALVPVLMGIGYLQSKPIGDEAKQILSTMHSSARRGADMVKQVLAFGRGTEGAESVIKVEALIHEMDRIVTGVFPKSIRWRVKMAADLWPVSGFATQLHQVMMNLCINARDAMPDGGQLTLSASNIVLDERQAALQPGARPGKHLVLTIADTGCGIAPDVRDKIFQPFFTTKAPDKGTGLGLSTALDIVRNHGGFITVESKVGRGTEFTVFLPATQAATEPDAEGKTARLPAGSGELILVVDDEAAICEITRVTLESFGYRVLIAGGGPEAVAIFADHRNDIRLALTDTAMPLMDGRATCLALRRMNPQLKIIAASGDPDLQKEDDTTLRTRVNAVIRKPYTVEKLLTTIHQVLSGAV